MQYLFQHELQALELLPVIREVNPMKIKIIIEEHIVMRAIHYSCIKEGNTLFLY